MLNVQIEKAPIGPNGVYGEANIAIVEGKLKVELSISPKALIDAAAAKIGGPIPAEVAKFIENAVGLA